MRLLIIFCLFSNLAFAANNDFQWIQYVTGNKLSARSITYSSECPNIKIDNIQTKMNFRASYYDAKLKKDIKVCEYDVTGANQVNINNQSLKMPEKIVNRFVVIGDTGCESSIFSEEHRLQKCDEKSWPFKLVADRVAQLNPSFVIHVGDYIYRNKYTNKIDAEKNKTLQWSLFKEEFFEPARNLLNNAPMIFVRGNHESCSTTGIGWFLFLDPSHHKESCLKYTAPYMLQINDLNFAIFDSSNAAKANQYSEEQLNKYRADFIQVAKNLDRPAWMLIHIPVLGVTKLSEHESVNPQVNYLVINHAFGSDLTNKIPLAISGHFHFTAELTRDSDKFRQFIFGNGGSNLNPSEQKSFVLNYNGNKGIAKVGFGYAVFDRIDGTKWKVSSYGLDGSLLFSSEISSNS